MTATPGNGAPGTDVTVQGAGFCCPDVVVGSSDDVGGTSDGTAPRDDYSVPVIWGADQEVGTATIHGDGTFDGTATVPVDAEAGTDFLEVCEDAEEGACASAPFEVTVEPEPEPEETPDSTESPEPTDPGAGVVQVDETVPDDGVALPRAPVADEGSGSLTPVVLSVVGVALAGAVVAAFLLWRQPRPPRSRPEQDLPARVVVRPDPGAQTIGRPGEPAVRVGAQVDLGAGTTTLDERGTP
jgi:hypothetical protein